MIPAVLNTKYIKTLYIYLGIASILGISAGVVIACFFGLDAPSQETDDRAAVAVRTAKEYRAARQKKKLGDIDPVMAYAYGGLRTGMGAGDEGRSGGLVGDLILEEVGKEEDDEDVDW